MRIAHLSDVHPLELTGVSPLRFFNKRLAGGLNLLTRRRNRHPLRLLDALCDDINRAAPDQVVVTGDLSNLSFPSELLRARQSLERLHLPPRDITAIPGNHDVYVWEAFRAKHFEHCLSPYCLPDDAPFGTQPSFPFFRLRGEVAIVASNSALPSPPPLADGWLGRRQIHAIEQLLSALRGKFRVLLVHHPPVPHPHDFLRGLRDRGALRQALLRAGCELVLHGHEHRDMRGTIEGRDGPIPVIGVGSGTFDDPRRDRRARYNIYTIEDGRLAGVETRIHDADADRFTPQ